MAVVVIDLYDSGVLVCDGARILANSASFALIDSDNTIVVGETAAQQAHLRPREVSTNFWCQLAATGDTKHVVCNAELAFKHLQYVWQQIENQDYQVILATPNTFAKHDLGLLLGICKKLSIPVIGIVSKAVLALQEHSGSCRVVYLEILQQQIVITEILQEESRTTASNTNLVLKTGIQSLTDDLAKHIAKKFIAETRFDPMHIAKDEQQFYDKLSTWLYQLESNDTIKCKLSSTTGDYAVEIHKDHILNSNRALFIEVLNNLMSLSLDKNNIIITCSPSCSQIFGLIDYLSSLPGCAVTSLSHIDIAKQALQHQEEICTKDSQVHYTTSLSSNNNKKTLNKVFNSGSLLDLSQRPTHVLINNHAFLLSEINYVSHKGEEGIIIDAGHNENSLCKITSDRFSVSVEKMNCRHVYLNGKEMGQQQSVQIGDRLNVDDKSYEIVFISVN